MSNNINWGFVSGALLAAKKLADAGHPVTETDMPGLFNVTGIANDVTVGQMIDIAAKLPGGKSHVQHT